MQSEITRDSAQPYRPCGCGTVPFPLVFPGTGSNTGPWQKEQAWGEDQWLLYISHPLRVNADGSLQFSMPSGKKTYFTSVSQSGIGCLTKVKKRIPCDKPKASMTNSTTVGTWLLTLQGWWGKHPPASKYFALPVAASEQEALWMSPSPYPHSTIIYSFEDIWKLFLWPTNTQNTEERKPFLLITETQLASCFAEKQMWKLRSGTRTVCCSVSLDTQEPVWPVPGLGRVSSETTERQTQKTMPSFMVGGRCSLSPYPRCYWWRCDHVTQKIPLLRSYSKKLIIVVCKDMQDNHLISVGGAVNKYLIIKSNNTHVCIHIYICLNVYV